MIDKRRTSFPRLTTTVSLLIDASFGMAATVNDVSSAMTVVPDSLHKRQKAHWIQIPLEHGGTYLFWKSQMENFFRIHHVTNIVDGFTSDGENPDGSSNPQYDVWMEKSWIVLCWIQAAVGPPMFSLVMNHEYAKDCWRLLETHLSPRKSITLRTLGMICGL